MRNLHPDAIKPKKISLSNLSVAPAGTQRIVNGKAVISTGPKWVPAVVSNKNTLAVFGTSIENFTLSPDGTAYLSNGALTIANALMGWPFKNVYDFGVDGDKSTGFITRWQAVLDKDPGWVWVGFPINDVIFDDVPLADTLTNINFIYETFRLYGCSLVLNLGGPISAFSTDTSGAKKQRYFAIRKAIEKYAAENDNVYLVDSAYTLTDPQFNGGYALAGVTSDGIHDNYVGAYKKALLIKAAIGQAVKAKQYKSTSAQAFHQHVMNPIGQGDKSSGTDGYVAGTGITGTGPTCWQVAQVGTGTAVGSRSSNARPYDAPAPFSQKYVVTSVAANDGVKISYGSTANGNARLDVAWAVNTGYGIGARRIPTVANGYYYTAIVSGTSAASEPAWPTVEGATIVDSGVKWLCRKLPTAGEKWYAEVEFSITAVTNGAAAQVALETYDAAGTLKDAVYGHKIDTGIGFAFPAATRDMVVRTPVMTISSGYNIRYIFPSLTVLGDTANGTVTVEIHRINMVRVDD